MARKGTANREASGSEATRERLIEAGLTLFAEHGFDSVSTRALANAAQANQAAIPYHFQSKEGLYMAVAERVVEIVRAGMEPVLEAVQERHREGVTNLALAREDVAMIITSLLRRIISQPHRCEIGSFIMREQMQPSAAMEQLYGRMIGPLHAHLAALVAALRGLGEDDPDVIIEVHALFGQAVVFGVHRYTLKRRLGADELDEEHLVRITGVVRNMVLRQFPTSGN
ncbi:transcriptional regulator [Alcanivorax hongdengensis A-11-3]|uniref:Transcriptional regulator n=1 Tax=Alcanivorax hongdengensis A-11-3 TaxID=1177179 RepID=L0WE16_9GAMM|nr:CerR family C-terminal domain-containing protein [Alcanivorax hongdengensis]EKF74382.1 transcriptional regulator [Alcanivorax hongdengensis A-11-3]